MPSTYIRHERKVPSEKSWRVRVPQWIDPFPWMQGSSIEKMVMAECVRRSIYFQHSTTSNALPWLRGSEEAFGSDPAKMKADLLFPQYHIWMEIQGAYFHSLPGAMERDALRFALVKAAGWTPIYWWEDDIRTRLMELFDAVPEFYRVNFKLNQGWKVSSGVPFFEGEAPDTLAGLRTALARRAKPDQAFVSRRRRKRRRK